MGIHQSTYQGHAVDATADRGGGPEWPSRGPTEGAGLFVAPIANATPCLQVYNAKCITCRVMSAAAAAQKSVDTSKQTTLKSKHNNGTCMVLGLAVQFQTVAVSSPVCPAEYQEIGDHNSS